MTKLKHYILLREKVFKEGRMKDEHIKEAHQAATLSDLCSIQ